MRALLAAFGTRGDVQPMLALARALRARGHEVTLCAPPNFAGWAASHGVALVPVGSDFERFVARMGRNIAEGLRLLRGEVRAQFEQVDGLAAGHDVLLAASAFVAGPSLAARHRLAYAYATFCPMLLRSREHPAPPVPWQGLPAWGNALSWRAYDRLMHAVFARQTNAARRAWGLAPVASVWSHLFEGATLLGSEPALSPAPRDAPAGTVQTGAWFFDDATPLDARLEAFLAAGPPPVYLGFGSMADATPQRTAALLLEAARGAGVRALVSRGWARFTALEPSDDALWLDDAPHATLFPRVAAAVHHGGAGTTAAAARAGAPQLVVPHILDQYYWGARVASLGLGPAPIARSALTVERLTEALRALVREPRYAAAARATAARIDGGGLARAVDALEGLARRGGRPR